MVALPTEGAREDGRLAFGFNSEVSYRRRTYHVQTEFMPDAESPTINTLIYAGGTLVEKVTTSCVDLDELADPRHLEGRVKRQHQEVLGRIKRGGFPHR